MSFTTTTSSTTNPLRTVCLNCGETVQVVNYDHKTYVTTNSPCGCVDGGMQFLPAKVQP